MHKRKFMGWTVIDGEVEVSIFVEKNGKCLVVAFSSTHGSIVEL